MNNKGLTLIELLITMLIMAIMFIALYITVSSLYLGQSKQISKSIVSSDVNTTVLLLDKLLRSTGFGIDKDNIDTAITINATSDSISFKTLMGFDTESGSWEICSDNGTRTSTYPAVSLSVDKTNLQILNESEYCDKGSIIYKCKDNSTACNDPYFYIHSLSLSSSSTESFCYKNTHTLELDTNRPLLYCVYNLKFEYDSEKKILKVAYLIQNGRRNKSKLNKTYKLLSTSITPADDEFYYYRWLEIEDTIFLENLK